MNAPASFSCSLRSAFRAAASLAFCAAFAFSAAFASSAVAAEPRASVIPAGVGEGVAQPQAVDVGARVSGLVRLLFAGDLALAGVAVADGSDPFADFADDLAAAELSIGTLAQPLATADEASSMFPGRLASPALIDRLAGRFDALSVASDGVAAHGQGAFLETLALLDLAGIGAVGGGRRLNEAHVPQWFERSGLSIAVVACNEAGPRAAEAGPDWPGLAWCEDSHVVRDIRAARAAGADLVISLANWRRSAAGAVPDARRQSLARLMIEAGADAVIGNDPNAGAENEIEIHAGRPIIHGLGRFIADQAGDVNEANDGKNGNDADADAAVGRLLYLTVDGEGVRDWRTVPVFRDREGLPRRTPPPEIFGPFPEAPEHAAGAVVDSETADPAPAAADD